MRRIFPLLACLATLISCACAPSPVATEPPVVASNTPVPVPSETSTPEPSATLIPSVTPIPTETSTATPTPDYTQIHLVRTYAVYQQSSQVFLNMGTLLGEYYAVGHYPKMENVDFNCEFDADKTTEMVCTGTGIPFGLGIYFILYKAETDEPIYNNIVTFTGPIPSPVGVVCEIEPLWESNQGDLGCWAITCYQNGVWYGGTGDTCYKPWPFDWMYTYP